MHRRLWLFAGAAFAGLLLVAAAGAMTTVAHDSAASQAAPGATLKAAPFAQAWAHVPRTQAARKAKTVLIFGMEQDVAGFNTLNADENAYWAALTGNTPVLRGNYIIDDKGVYHLDLATAVTATRTSLTIKIRPNANWWWGGRKLPVTYKDYVYTWKQIVDKNNTPASTTGYDLITGFTHVGNKQVTFKWSKPFADYRDLFGTILPSAALVGLDFDSFWANCVCGTDSKPVSDGPFYVSNYTKGQGLTLRPNPFWYGKKPALKEIDWKLITDTNSEIQAMRGGEVDAINPSPQTALSQLQHQSGLTYSAIPGFTQEHLDLNIGPGLSNPLLRAPWMRHAVMMGLDRAGLINALYSQIAPTLKPLNNALWELGVNAVPQFNKWNFNPAKAIALLKAHGCTGGPASWNPTTKNQDNKDIWTCAGRKAEFRWNTTAGNQRRATSAAIFAQNLQAVGIKVTPAFEPANPTFFGTRLPNHDFDIAEYAWLGGPDPSGFDAIYQCINAAKNLGGSNYKQYCNHNVDALIRAGDSELNPTKRTADYQKAAAIMANDTPIVPLYAPPSILVYKSAIKGMAHSNNPTLLGPTWNVEQWHW